jgi:hypothetical protein
MTEKEFLARWIMHYIHPEYFYIPWSSGGTPPQPYILIEKTVTENGTYDPADDDADGYSKVTVTVGNVIPLTVTENGWYECWDYDCDGFCPVTVDVPSDFTFCYSVEYNDISPVVDLDSDQYLYDSVEEFGLKCETENSDTVLKIYKILADGTKTSVWQSSSQTAYGEVYITVTDASTGEVEVHYTYSSAPTVWYTQSVTSSDFIGYGASGNEIVVTKEAINNA